MIFVSSVHSATDVAVCCEAAVQIQRKLDRLISHILCININLRHVFELERCFKNFINRVIDPNSTRVMCFNVCIGLKNTTFIPHLS